MDRIVCDAVYPPVSAASSEALLDALRGIVGKRYVLTDEGKTRRFRTGYRCGGGPVLAVVRPGSLVEQWRALRICVVSRPDCPVSGGKYGAHRRFDA